MAEETGTWDGSSPWLFLLGALVFLGGLVLFVYDMATGTDVIRSISVNAVGAALLIGWAAHDTLYDPNSDVATRRGAAGTALLLYGLYLVLSGVVIAATGLLFHQRATLGVLYIGIAVVTVIIGFLIFPTNAVLGTEEDYEPTGEDGDEPTEEESA